MFDFYCLQSLFFLYLLRRDVKIYYKSILNIVKKKVVL